MEQFVHSSFLSELSVRIGVEVGELSVNAEELLDVMPGHFFSFNFDPLAVVSLRLADEQVATGRFVLRDNKLAIEIVSVGENTEDLAGTEVFEEPITIEKPVNLSLQK